MAQILDKQGLQHYANKMCNADNRKVGSKSLPTALNDIDTAIDGFKTLFESEYGTPINMELTNNQNIFTVGTSTDIDKKDDVENSFTDVELSGNSLVNCVLIDKLYKDSNYLECENSPVITKGNITLKSRQFNHVRFCPKIECGIIKPNTKYTLIFNVTSNNLTGRTNLTHTNTDTLISAFPFTNTIQPKQTGIFKYVLTSKEDIGSCNTLLRTIIWNDCSTEGETITFSLMILEGDWTNKPIPQYFEGMKSVGQDDVNGHKIEILSRNDKLIINKDKLLNEGIFYPTKGWSAIRLVTKAKRVKIVVTNKDGLARQTKLSVKNDIESEVRLTRLFERNESFNKVEIDYELLDTNILSFCTYGENDFNGDFFDYYDIEVFSYDNIEDVTPTTRYNKKEISLNEPLRGLPNGVKDTIEKINDEWKIVRRCVEVTLNGSETSWYRNTDFNGTKVLFFFINTKHSTSLPEGAVKTVGSVVNVQCDSFSCHALKDRLNNKNNNIEAIIYSDSSNPLIQFHINKSKLASEDLAGFKQWLSQNPTKVVYELETPIIEDISPVTLQCWKNGTISLVDEVLPVETTHTVALNKSAQIQKNIEELTALRNRVKVLEEQYDKTALNQAYEVELLRLDMQLDNII